MKNNSFSASIHRFYLIGFFIILALPLLAFSPYFFPADWGKTLVFRSIMAILLCLFAWQFLYRKQGIIVPNLRKNHVIWALGALLATYLLATLLSPNPYFSLLSWPIRSGGFINFTFYIILAALSFVLLKKEDWPKVFDFSIIIAVLVSSIAVIQYLGILSSIFISVPGRPPSTMGNPILLAIYLLLLVFITLALGIKEKRRWKKIGYFAAVALFLYVILLTASRASYLGVLAGGVYFFILYPGTPKRIMPLKIMTIIAIVAVIGVVAYANLVHQYPAALENNRLFKSIEPRLQIKNLIEDSRFAAYVVELKMIPAKPWLGYGPENFPSGFDRYYNPDPALIGIVGWWDRAHDIIMQTLIDAGIFALIAYLALFATAFWQAYKARRTHKPSALLPHAVGATLIGYFVANLFSFDSFGSYLIFFLIVGYAMHLASSHLPDQETNAITGEQSAWKFAVVGILVCASAIFLWQYNLVPFFVNAQVNKAQRLVLQKNCGDGMALMEKTLTSHSMLDSYVRLEYVDFAKTCADFYPQNELAYKKRGLDVINEAIKIQPSYTRYWIFMGATADDLAAGEKDATIKTNLIAAAEGYLKKATELAPQHLEVLMEQARLALTKGDYALAEQYARHCIALNSDPNGCYFYLGLSQIYRKNVTEGNTNVKLASAGYGINSRASLEQLSNAYGFINDYPNLALTYEQLVNLNPDVAQYHSSLAFFYKQLGRWQEARREALLVLKISPESKANVEAFLATLPKQ